MSAGANDTMRVKQATSKRKGGSLDTEPQTVQRREQKLRGDFDGSLTLMQCFKFLSFFFSSRPRHAAYKILAP